MPMKAVKFMALFHGTAVVFVDTLLVAAMSIIILCTKKLIEMLC